MAKTSAIITATEHGTGKTLQKTLTNVNPDATSAQLATLGHMLNGLTTNVYVSTDRVDKYNCDTEDSGGDDRLENTVELKTPADADWIANSRTYNKSSFSQNGNRGFSIRSTGGNLDGTYFSYMAPGATASFNKNVDPDSGVVGYELVLGTNYTPTEAEYRGRVDRFTEDTLAFIIVVPGDDNYKDGTFYFTIGAN